MKRTRGAWIKSIGFIFIFLILNLTKLSSSYLILVNESDEPGTVIFNASVYKLGSERHYKLDSFRSAYFVHNLVQVNHKTGQVSLKKSLKCDGIHYPNVFTFYVDSTTNQLRSVNYYSLPLRIYVTGEHCKDDDSNQVEGVLYEEHDSSPSTRRRARASSYAERPSKKSNNSLAASSYNFHNERSQKILSIRGKRHSNFLHKHSQNLRSISHAKQWVSETLASYAIYTTDKWNKICLKQSQLVNNLNAFLPRTVIQYCRVRFLDASDIRVKIESKNHDLVASDNVCISEPMWKVIVTFNIQCTRNDIIDSDHRLKIIYHHQEFNDTDIARRVRRELRNQSPYFEQALYVASVLEERPPGVVVATVRARDPEDSPVVYSMTSLLDSRSQSLFKLDSHSGVVSTSTSLDRELMEVHYFRIVATDDSFPPRSGTTTLQVNVLDCNDHSPVFEADQFDASIREGSTVGSTVLTVRATDQDTGKNAEIEYVIESISGGGLTSKEQDAQTFGIDSRRGVITTKTTLDREETDVYTIIVVAMDSPKVQAERKSATATVVVKVLDDNDNYPQFSERAYSVQIKEDEWENKVVAHIKATDADEGNNAAIRYAIIGGNTQSQFSIDSMTGDVSLVKPLDYETNQNFRLVIRAQDGGNPSRSNTTQLLVNVIDVNDNAPRFYVSQYQESVLESVPVGYNIVRLQAYDADQGANAEIQYSISERDENFPLTVDSKSGWIQTTRQLDREEQSRYAFQVLATDGGTPPKSASASVIIIIQDVNDNDPVFQPKYYEAAISEDVAPGSSVTTVTATDPDEDSRLHYDIISGNTRGRFAINVQNGKGVITVAQPLDYKQERRFLLTVSATDNGGRMDTANVNVNITDANNFAPVFDNSPYSATVFEDSPIGTTVLIVSATDNDVGINAQITYSLQDESINGFSQSTPFAVNSKTGAITTIAALDREKISAYLLTVKATDGGQPSFSDTTDIEIAVTDVNDNAPVFNVPLYQASISEDALIGTSVIQICAEDADSGLNGRLKYSLSEKDVEDGSFIIDPTSGTIRTNKALDRESVAVYHLIAIATDKGTPAMSGSVEVQVKLEDVNDSPPSFSADKLTMYIKENSPIGSVIGNIEAHDPDEGVNAIIQYSIIGGDDSNSFSLVSRPGSEGAQLLTMTELDYESTKKRFELVIRAASPPLRSDVHVEVLVTDVNDNAPVLKDFQVIFNNFRDHFPVGEIGRVPAFDADVTDQLTFRVLSGNNADLIRLNTSSGGITLSPQLNTNVPRQAYMEISVTDGINEAKATMQLIVRLITEEMLFNSVTVRLNEMTEEAFLSPLLNFFLDGLSAIIPCPKENIFLFSIQEDQHVTSRILNVSFSAMRPDLTSEEYYTANYLQERVYLNRAILARLATVDVLPFDDNLCVREPCLNFEQCSTVLKFGNASTFIHSDTVLFRPIYPVNTFVCHCPDGFTGSKEHYLCDTEVDLCYSTPCQNNGRCIRREGGYTCVCEQGYFGATCEMFVGDLKPCETDLCRDGRSCLLSDDVIDQDYLSYTPTCELKSRSFARNSFATFESLRSRYRFNIKLRFSTLEENGLIFYNGRYNELHDFIALEIIDGHMSFSFSLGAAQKSVRVFQAKTISDGMWHTVEVVYFNRTATVIIDDCDRALGLKGNLGPKWDCANQTTLVLDRKCSSATEPCHRFLDLTGPFQLGGLPKLPVNFPIKTRDFVGCISDLYIDHRLIDLNSFISDNGTMAGCPQKALYCISEPCFNGGTCHEGWNGHICSCPEGYTGNACQEIASIPWRFSENSILSFNPLLRPIQLPWLIGLSIRTWQKDAFLMQIQVGQNSSVVLALKSGALYFTYENESPLLSVIDLADGKWHRIDITWVGSDIKLSIDYDQRIGIYPISKKIQGQYVGKIVLGNIDKTMAGAEEFYGYEGCIQDIRVGGVQSVLNWPSVRENVEDGCSSKGRCPKTCPKHSLCVESWDEAHCECSAGYVGPDCIPTCALNPCMSGVCHADQALPKFYHCECNTTSHFGEYCENVIELPCPAGWWGEKGCGPCKCNVRQGYNADCNKTTGQCYCKNNHYQPVNETSCLPCDCYAVGSFGSGCNHLTGQCVCREGVIGRRCDSCSNPYAEVTLTGCEVVYDACPRSFSEGVWWDRTLLGQTAIQDCPGTAKGKGSRVCDIEMGRWQFPDMFNCTSEPFIELRKQLSQLENKELELNAFLSTKLARDLKSACQIVAGAENPTKPFATIRTIDSLYSYYDKNDAKHPKEEDTEISFLSDEVKFSHNRLYGADILIIEGLLHEIINFEFTQRGLNLSHSQDKDFVDNMVFSASEILNREYKNEWDRINDLVDRGPQDLVEAFTKYMTTLAQSQHDTYTKPFEVVHKNMAFGLDIVTPESLFGYNTGEHDEPNKQKIVSTNKLITEKVIVPDTSAFFQYSAKGKHSISFPKYDNYIQDKTKFDKHTKVLIPLNLLGIKVPGGSEFKLESSDYRAIISYTQYRDAGTLFPEIYDGTISRRWGVEVQIASAIFSLVILTPASIEDYTAIYKKDNKRKEQNMTTLDSMTNGKKSPMHENSNEKIEIMPHVVAFDEQSPNDVNKGGNDFPSANIPKNQNDSHNIYRRSVNRETNQSADDNLSYKTLESHTLLYPVRLQMLTNINRLKFGPRLNPQCIRWNKLTGSWTRLGCQTEIPNYKLNSMDQDIYINCTCTQISTYAVLVDVVDFEDIPEPSLYVQIAMYSSFLLALPILAIVLIALIILRGTQTNSNNIHQNIVLCIFFAELLFFIGMQARKTMVDNEFLCKLVAILLHYTWLAAFVWMTIDCIHLYRMLTEMRDINHGPMGFYFSLGYGAPAIIVGLAVGVRAHEYGNSLFCWLSVYEPVVWWLVGPISGMSIINLFILFMCIKSAFTLKDHILGFGNLRTLLLLSVISLPLMGIVWVLTVLAASENSQLLILMLCIAVLVHAIFCIVGYCVVNQRVRDNLRTTFLQCMGKKVPLVDSSNVVENRAHTMISTAHGNSFLSAAYDGNKRNIGISASSTTSRSTAKTSSSPYRSEDHLRHTSTSTSNYNSANEYMGYIPGYPTRTEKEGRREQRKASESGSETDARSLELASSHSSDDEESRVGRENAIHRNIGVSTTHYLPNITEHVQATTPPELNIVQSPQLFPNVNKSAYVSQWSNHVSSLYRPSQPNAERWSQETASDNDILSYKVSRSSSNMLPNPDVTDVSHLDRYENKMYMQPSLLENTEFAQGGINSSDCNTIGSHGKMGYDQISRSQTLRRNCYDPESRLGYPYAFDQPKHDDPLFPNMDHIDHRLAKPSFLIKDRNPNDILCLRENYHFKQPEMGLQNVPPILENECHESQEKHLDCNSERISEGSDKFGYHFPFTAEEDHLHNGACRTSFANVGFDPEDCNVLSQLSPGQGSCLPSPVLHSTLANSGDNVNIEDDETTV